MAKSQPLNKKIRSLSVRGSNNYCGSASAICSVESWNWKKCGVQNTNSSLFRGASTLFHLLR